MLKNLLNRLRATPVVATPAESAAPAAPAASTPTPAVVSAPAVSSAEMVAADALIDEGNALEDAGDLQRAEALYRSALAQAPGHARAHLNLGIVLAARDDADGAAAAYEAVLAIAPRHPFGNYNYARLAFVRGDLARAESLVGTALESRPDFAEALVVQSNVQDALGKLGPAIESMKAALRLRPDDAGAWFNLALLLRRQAFVAASEEAVRHALEGAPDNAGALALQSRLLRDLGFPNEALVPLRRLLAADPHSWVDRSFELMLMTYADGIPTDEIHRRHVDFGVDLEREVPVRFDRYRDRGDSQRRLRVGYLSCDFRMHPVTFFLSPLLEQHDRSQVEVFCYSYGSVGDAATDRLRRASDQWRDCASMSDSQIADAIHADGIDVLIDLVGHTSEPRLGVFSQRPAPVQVSWIGYLGTSGLSRMDFRLSDRRADPIEIAQPLHTERLVHMPVSQWCYRPMLDVAPGPGAPVARNGHVTFGSFNAALKVSAAMARRWGEILARVPGSRLVIANVNPERKRTAILDEIAAMGVAVDRVEFQPRVLLDKYMDLYNGIDISLDAFPYGGGTTTFDSLWMSVPVVATFGETSVSRSAASLLAELGLDDWIAPSIDQYVDTAVARASDIAGLVALRRTLHARLKASPLTDMVRFTRDLETAYRDMWLKKTR